MSSGPSPATPGPTGAWGRVVALPSHHQGGPGLEGISLMVPHPTSCGFGLAHQLSSCECSLHHHRLPQLKLGAGGGGGGHAASDGRGLGWPRLQARRRGPGTA